MTVSSVIQARTLLRTERDAAMIHYGGKTGEIRAVLGMLGTGHMTTLGPCDMKTGGLHFISQGGCN